MAGRRQVRLIQAIKILMAITLILGIPTLIAIRNLVPIFVVYSAIGLLALYLLSLVWLSSKESRGSILLAAVLSVFTLSATFVEPAHLELLAEGYVPAIVIISAGTASQIILLLFCIGALVSRTRAVAAT
jgi:K+-sensing histidine kinase KdpD